MKHFAILLALAAVAGATATDPWQMERQDRWGTGRALVGPDPSTFRTPWIFKRLNNTSPVSHGPALGENGIGYFGTWVNDLCTKFDMSTGSVLGGFNALNYVQSTPAILPGGLAVFIASPRPHSFDPPGRVFRVNTTTMDFDWFFDTHADWVNDYEAASPILGPEGDVAIGSTTGTAWRLHSLTGSPVWTRPGLHGIKHTAAFSRDDSFVFFANGNRITAVNWATGAVEWTFDSGSTAGAPAVSPEGPVVFGNQAGSIYALHPQTGAVVWNKSALGAIQAAPAFSADGVAYVPCLDFRLYAHRMSDGFRLWSFTGHHENRSSPSVGHDGSIYLYNRVGWFYRIAPNGTAIWTRNFNNGDSRGGPISIGPDGTLYLGANAPNVGMAIIKQHALALQFTTFTMDIGDLVSGTAGDLVDSDDQYVTMKTGGIFNFARTDPQIRARMELNSPQDRLATFTLKFEASCTLGGSALQRVEMFNFGTGQWEVIDERAATTTDTPWELTVSTNASRFVQDDTGLMRLRANWFVSNGPRIWNARIDRATLVEVVPDWAP